MIMSRMLIMLIMLIMCCSYPAFFLKGVVWAQRLYNLMCENAFVVPQILCNKEKSFIFAEMPNAMDKRLTDKIVRYFATQPIVKAWVFGSYARGEAHSGSDIDILVVFDKEAKVSLMRHAKISLELSEILGFDVDLITEGTLLSFAERTANNDKILIYERAS